MAELSNQTISRRNAHAKTAKRNCDLTTLATRSEVTMLVDASETRSAHPLIRLGKIDQSPSSTAHGGQEKR